MRRGGDGDERRAAPALEGWVRRFDAWMREVGRKPSEQLSLVFDDLRGVARQGLKEAFRIIAQAQKGLGLKVGAAMR
ncbi:MAG: hypothetical protein L0206_01725 [Actinobacteria bacterium]|nr:hypothetical protein [Actinomycetota bacterium]